MAETNREDAVFDHDEKQRVVDDELKWREAEEAREQMADADAYDDATNEAADALADPRSHRRCRQAQRHLQHKLSTLSHL